MAQVTKGLILGRPGVSGSPAIGIFYGEGSPNQSSDPAIINSQLGSLFLDFVGAQLWIKTAAPNVWTAK